MSDEELKTIIEELAAEYEIKKSTVAKWLKELCKYEVFNVEDARECLEIICGNYVSDGVDRQREGYKRSISTNKLVMGALEYKYRIPLQAGLTMVESDDYSEESDAEHHGMDVDGSELYPVLFYKKPFDVIKSSKKDD